MIVRPNPWSSSPRLTREQAEVHLEILEEIVEDEMATKADILSLRSDTRGHVEGLRMEMQSFRSEVQSEIQELRSEIQSEIQELRSEVQSEIKELRSEMRHLEYKLTIKLGLMLTAAVGLLATLQRFS